ncbi:type II secretion system protein [Thermosipho ferrireducens]|uniref:Type II secretion system protein n=1 Tax=Thermosipho ferrireducens TaxID=2571116 RepID=A0ABX7S8L7_9BACT|nr:type II secretion system protein [Thermosipho ferrireducens]QTA38967.1 type II secretion system protein [Thermosipho ferrireducens]
MRKGFTLVELLIVLAVIAALLSVATPVALNAVRKAKATQVAQNLRNLKTAIESYINIEQSTPSTFTDLTNYLTGADLKSSYDYSITDNSTYYSGEVWYTKDDVTYNELVKILPDATEIGTAKNPGLKFQVAKWW